MVHLRGKNVLVGEIKGLQANDIQIDPPAALLQQQFVAEEVGEAGQRPIGITKDGCARKYLIPIANLRAHGNMFDRAIRVKPESMPVAKERSDAQALHGR